MVYSVIIVEHPVKKEREETGALETILAGPFTLVARNDQAAAIAAVMQAEIAKGVDMTRLEVLVRPF